MTSDLIRLSDKQQVEVRRSNADVLELTATWEAGQEPPRLHWHPRQHEHFEVLSGELTAEISDDQLRTFHAGESFDVPPRTAHRMWNASDGRTTATWTITPAMRTEAMFRDIERGIGGLRAVRMLITYRHEFRLGAPRR